MEEQLIETKKKLHGIGNMTVEEAYERICTDLKAIYNINDTI
jgi:hypothetical protein